MATYGFRVHTMEPHVRRTEKFLQIEDAAGAGGEADACDQMYRELLELQGILNIGTPTYFVDEQSEEIRAAALEAANDLAYFLVHKVNRDGRVLEVIVETGKEADHDALASRDGTHEEMTRRAPVRRSTVVFAFPEKGGTAIMLSDVRGRNYAGQLLIQWLTRTAQRANVQVTEKGKKEEPWLNWKLTPQIDGERLDGVLSGSSEHTLKLRRRYVNAQGGRASFDLELVQFGLKKTGKDAFLAVVLGMADRRNKGTEAARRAAAAVDVITLVDPDVAGVGFNDGELSFSENGKVQTVNAETVDRLFVYPTGSVKLDPTELRKKAAAVVGRIALASNVEVTVAV